MLAQAEVVLQLEGGRRLIAPVLHDGSFAFAEVPLGVHSLSVGVPGLLYPTLKLDVGISRKDKVAAEAADMPGVSESACRTRAMLLLLGPKRRSKAVCQCRCLCGCLQELSPTSRYLANLVVRNIPCACHAAVLLGDCFPALPG